MRYVYVEGCKKEMMYVSEHEEGVRELIPHDYVEETINT